MWRGQTKISASEEGDRDCNRRTQVFPNELRRFHPVRMRELECRGSGILRGSKRGASLLPNRLAEAAQNARYRVSEGPTSAAAAEDRPKPVMPMRLAQEV